MTERNEFPRTLSTAIPAIPVPAPSTEPVTATEEEARARIAALEREARAIGNQPAAALLFHELGLLWESPLKHARNAAVAYQAAFKLAPKFLANIRAARRLFSEVGNWQMVAQLLDAELQATEGKRARAALLFEKSQILEQRLSREVDGAAALAACLALEPEDITLLVGLEQVFTEKGDFPSVVRVNQLLAQTVTDDGARAHYLTSAGLLLEDRLKDLPAAAQAFRQAFAVDRRDPQLLAAIKRVAQREGTVDEELAALAAEAEGQGPGAAPTFLQIAKAYERLGRPEDALAALLAARRVSPSEPLVLAELARIYEARGRFEELAEVLLAWVTTNNDQSEFIAINLRLASLYEELKREHDAAARYRAILERSPGHAGALAGLGKLAFRLQNWIGLVEAYDAEAAASDDARTRAGRLYKAGETLEERLGQIDDAIGRYKQALTLSPGYLPATKALTRLFEKLGRWGELISMHEQELLQLSDREQQISTLNKIAGLYEDRLEDLPRAIETLRRVLELSPDHLPSMRNLARLYERAQQWQELLALNEQEARLATDQKQVISLAHRSAEILEESVKDRPAAIAAWERVLQLAPNYLPALRSLGRLYGQDQRWDSLINMYRAEAEMAPSTDQAAALIQKIGELYEQKLTDQNQAISSYREVLTLAPNHFPALRALARIYRTQGDWESLIEILRAEAANRTDPTERANAMFQAAAIWEDQLKKIDNAVDGYQEVLRLAPSHVTALQQLERILTARDDVKELIVLLDRQAQTGSPQVRVGASLKLARLYLDRLNETARAASACEAALAIEPQNLSALRLLERIKANDKGRRTELRARIAEVLGDEKLAAAMKLSTMDAASVPDTTLLAQLKHAYAADPTDESLGITLERALQRAGDASGLVELYERRRATTTDAADMLQLSLRIADLCESRLGDHAKARQAYEAALQSAPDLYPALLGLSRSLLRAGLPAEACKVLDQVGSTARDQATMLQALMEAAKIARDALKSDDAASDYYRKVLDRDPLHAEAGPALEELLARKGGAADLAALHEKRGEAKNAQKDLFNAARDFFNAARIWLDGVKDRDRAMAALDRALMAMPTLPDALELKASLAIEAQSYAEAAAALAVRVQQGGDPLALARVHLRLGALYHDHLSDQTRAAAHLQTALASDASNAEALERLATIHTASRNWTGAADCLRRLLEVDNSIAARAKHTMMLARITDEGFGDVGQAIVLYRKALELVPGDSAALDRLVALYERTGAMSDLVTMLEQQVQQASDAKKAIALKMRIGQLQAKSLDDAQRAITTYRQITELDPTFVPAHAALAELFSRDTTSIAMAIETHRTLLRLEPARVESLHALFRMWESLKQMDKAFCAAGLLVFLKAANEVELAFYSEGRNRLPSDLRNTLGPPDLMMVHHPAARNALVDVLRAIGDQFVKLNPPNLEQQGIDRRGDRMKNDHAVVKALSAVVQSFGGAEFEAYQSRKGLVYLETGEPLAVLVGPDVVRRFNIREQRFLFGRAALGLVDRAAIVRKLSMGEFADVLGNSVRIHQPSWAGLGRRNEEQSKALRKAYSRRALKQLEEPASAMAAVTQVAIEPFVQGLLFSMDRAGLLVCADVAAGLGLLLREEAGPNAVPRAETTEAISQALTNRPDLKELMSFSLSDDFFRLRQRVGVSLG
ncbi:MAG: tetratricopeptide repeat protein [Myxococcaceae bacterium]|nr:tetratricopeptide repeat protein [Myxococcaceae bacterium]